MTTPSSPWRDYPCDVRTRGRKKKEWVKILGDPGNLQFNHLCGNGLCWESTHVYRGTQAQNVQDAYDHGAMTSQATKPEVREKIATTLRGRAPSVETTRKMVETRRRNFEAKRDMAAPEPFHPVLGEEMEAEDWLGRFRSQPVTTKP